MGTFVPLNQDPFTILMASKDEVLPLLSDARTEMTNLFLELQGLRDLAPTHFHFDVYRIQYEIIRRILPKCVADFHLVKKAQKRKKASSLKAGSSGGSPIPKKAKLATTQDSAKHLGFVSSAGNGKHQPLIQTDPAEDIAKMRKQAAIQKLRDEIANLQKPAEAEGASQTPTTAVATATAITEAALDSSVSNPTTPKAGNGKDDSEQETEGN